MPKINLLPVISVRAIQGYLPLEVNLGHAIYTIARDEFIIFAANRARVRAAGGECSINSIWTKAEPVGADPQP
jgi:hypothetical protein